MTSLGKRPIDDVIFVWESSSRRMQATRHRNQVPSGVRFRTFVQRGPIIGAVEKSKEALRRFMAAATTDDFDKAHAAAYVALKMFDEAESQS